MNENKEMNVEDLANMLMSSIAAKIEITLKNDEVKVEGGTALKIVDMYIICKALESVARDVLPMMKSPDAMKDCLKDIIDLMDFEGSKEDDNKRIDGVC